jgi:hypothetical protein
MSLTANLMQLQKLHGLYLLTAAATKMNKYRNLHNTRWGEHDIVNNKY